MSKLPIGSLSIKNFKAIRDTGPLEFTPLTVLIGQNGSGKSSLIEALLTIQTLAEKDLDTAMQTWRGLEYIRNNAQKPKGIRIYKKAPPASGRSIDIKFDGYDRGSHAGATIRINERKNCNEIFIEYEHVRTGIRRLSRGADGSITPKRMDGNAVPNKFEPGTSLAMVYLGSFIRRWQFLSLNPDAMGNPVPQRRTGGRVRLTRDGSNFAEYLLDFRTKDLVGFDGLIETLRYVLPYAKDLQPTATSEVGRSVYVQMTEAGFKVPGWLLSTGTLRILALLAVLRHPEPAPLVLIEEIENGLDPRAIHLIVEEIHHAVHERGIQVIATTHSPYLLDLLPLSSIVLVDRVEGEPRFWRPENSIGVKKWAKEFAPGQLYTMDRLVKDKGRKSD